MVKWECNDCGKVHRSNPDRCRKCGSTLLSQYQGDDGRFPVLRARLIAGSRLMTSLLMLALALLGIGMAVWSRIADATTDMPVDAVRIVGVTLPPRDVVGVAGVLLAGVGVAVMMYR